MATRRTKTATKATKPRAKGQHAQTRAATSKAALDELIAECKKGTERVASAKQADRVWDASPIRLKIEGLTDFIARVATLDDFEVECESKLFVARWHLESYRNNDTKLVQLALDADLLRGVSARLRDKGGQSLKDEDRRFLIMLCEHVERLERGAVHEAKGWIRLRLPDDLSYSRECWVSGMVLPMSVHMFAEILANDSDEGYQFARYCLQKFQLKETLPLNKKKLGSISKQIAGAFLGLTPAQVDERLSPRRNRRNKITFFADPAD